MIKLLFPLPKKLVIAFSGGVDSVAIANFLRHNCNYIRHEMLPHVLHVNPGLPKLVKKLVLDKKKLAMQETNVI